jgi:hypothetical protein
MVDVKAHDRESVKYYFYNQVKYYKKGLLTQTGKDFLLEKFVGQYEKDFGVVK